jgi:putative ABC transport system substrate-binding protein
MIGRRTLLAGLAVLHSSVTSAQRRRPLVIVLGTGSEAAFRSQIEALRQGLAAQGFVEPDGLVLEFAWADGDAARLRPLAQAVAARRPDVIATSGGPAGALAAKGATDIIPIVFAPVSYPVEIGLITSFARPGGNVTGVGGRVSELDAKRLELLCELVGRGRRLGALINRLQPNLARQRRDITDAAVLVGCEIRFEEVGSEADLQRAYTDFSRAEVAGLLVAADAGLFNWRHRIVDLAQAHRLPSVYQWREFVQAGGLFSFGPSILDSYRLVGTYVGRILKGEPVGALPVVQPTHFEVVLNAGAARRLGLTFGPSLLARADEVIE